MSKSFFNMQNDSRIGGVVDRFLKLLLLNVLWLVCSLPVITLGASTVGLHCGLRNYITGEDGTVKVFFRGFKEHFGSATLVWCAALIVGAGIFLSMRIASAVKGTFGTVITVVCSLCLLMLGMVLVYVFPIMARFSVKAGEAVNNSILLSVAYFPRTLGLIVLSILPVIIFLFFPSALVCLVFVWVPVGFSVCGLTAAGLLEPVFTRLEKGNS